MLRTIALGAEFLGNGLAAVALTRLAFHKGFSSSDRRLLFALFLLAMAVFCLSNVCYAVIVARPDHPHFGWGTAFESVVESVQIVIFLYVAPVLVTLIAITRVLQKRGHNMIRRKEKAGV